MTTFTTDPSHILPGHIVIERGAKDRRKMVVASVLCGFATVMWDVLGTSPGGYQRAPLTRFDIFHVSDLILSLDQTTTLVFK